MIDRTRTRLGYLEAELLEWLWARDDTRDAARDGDCEGTLAWIDVATAHAEVGRPRGLSRNTLHSTLERLVRKGLAIRERRGRAYAYRACVSRESWVRESLTRTFESTPGADPALLLASFVDLAERVDDAGLAELERLVRARRRARDRDEEGDEGGDS